MTILLKANFPKPKTRKKSLKNPRLKNSFSKVNIAKETERDRTQYIKYYNKHYRQFKFDIYKRCKIKCTTLSYLNFGYIFRKDLRNVILMK